MTGAAAGAGAMRIGPVAVALIASLPACSDAPQRPINRRRRRGTLRTSRGEAF